MPDKNGNPNTGDEFIKLAKEKGAVVKPSGNFFKIITPKGRMHLAGGHETLDKKTVKNTMRWFKLLGLLVIVLFIFFPNQMLQLFGLG